MAVPAQRQSAMPSGSQKNLPSAVSTNESRPNFNIDTETYSEKAVFLFEVSTPDSGSGTAGFEAAVRYQACSDVKCLPPVKKTATATLAFSPTAAPKPFSIPSGYLLVPAAAA